MLPLLLLPGDGVGLEILPVVRAALEALDARFGLGLDLHERPIGLQALATGEPTLPPATLELARTCAGVVLGPVDSLAYPPEARRGLSPSGRIRKELALHANIRPARTRAGVPARVPAMDLVIARENTEGFYSDRAMVRGSGEMLVTEDVAISVRKITAAATQRIGRDAFQLAARRRRRLTIVTKRNVLQHSDGLFHDTIRGLAEDYPEVQVDDVLVDAMCALLVRCPERFDVVVTSNLYGDILSDLANELAGGLGLGAALNAGREHAVAQAVHGAAPDIAGGDRANPSALLQSSAMLLDWLGRRRERPDLQAAAAALERALDEQLAGAAGRTQDLGGTLGTRAFGEALVARLAVA